MAASCGLDRGSNQPRDYMGPIGMTRRDLELPELVLQIGYRDAEASVFERFTALFVRVWQGIAEADRFIIARRLKWGQRELPQIGALPGVWLLPTVTKVDAYVSCTGGVMVFDAFAFEALGSEVMATHLIRHELAHVWQASTGMWATLADDQLEEHAEWMAKHWLARGWQAIPRGE